MEPEVGDHPSRHRRGSRSTATASRPTAPCRTASDQLPGHGGSAQRARAVAQRGAGANAHPGRVVRARGRNGIPRRTGERDLVQAPEPAQLAGRGSPADDPGRLAAPVCTAGDSGGYPRATAGANKWKVNVTVACQHNPDAGAATATQLTLICELTDRTTNGGGIPIPIKDLPAAGPTTGRSHPRCWTCARSATGG